jgi:hypothetical protein
LAITGASLALAATRWSAHAADQPLPTRVLGRTNARVTILGLGTAPIGEGPVDTPEAVRVFGAVMASSASLNDGRLTALPSNASRRIRRCSSSMSL